MHDIINQITEIEKSAKKLVADAQAELDALPGEIREALHKKRGEYMVNARRKISQVRQFEEEIMRRDLEAADKNHGKKMNALAAELERNMDAWVGIIFGECICSIIQR